jgi:UDP-glucuronate 4-epimerase
MSKAILVTGAAGFIGSHLCEALLNRGYKVTGIDNFDPFYDESIKRANLKTALFHDNFLFLEGDAGHTELLNEIPGKIDVVIHLAAKAGVLPSLKDPAAYIKVNVELTNSILEWMRNKGIKKLVFASSSSVYGNSTKTPFEESDNVNEPISPYAFTKRSCELMNYTYHTLYGMDIVNLRFFTVYGERQRPDLAIHKFVRLILNKRPITIYGDGETARDYTYFADTIDGVIAAVEYINRNEGVLETINLGNHHPVSLKELVQAIVDATDVEAKIVYEQMKPGDVNITYASIEKARRLLGYNPNTSLEEGLCNFIQWYRLQNEREPVK